MLFSMQGIPIAAACAGRRDELYMYLIETFWLVEFTCEALSLASERLAVLARLSRLGAAAAAGAAGLPNRGRPNGAAASPADSNHLVWSESE